ncbi:hypothetical protein HNR44_001383 [Geomicrobium halophilum]|uniref:Uncharacterized protein n=1 Tax=Geomicrobium halophilum TaxID=549000 RepID=A0A841PNS1_9BACL|nr:hypothetical protein [Geomicrobium halophilum]
MYELEVKADGILLFKKSEFPNVPILFGQHLVYTSAFNFSILSQSNLLLQIESLVFLFYT